MKVLTYFPFVVSAVCLAFAGAYRSVGMASVAVSALLIIAIRDSVQQYLESRREAVKPGIPEEIRKAIQEIQARMASIEYREKTRGF